MVNVIGEEKQKIIGIIPQNDEKLSGDERFSEKIRKKIISGTYKSFGKTSDYLNLAQQRLDELEKNKKLESGKIGDFLKGVAVDAGKQFVSVGLPTGSITKLFDGGALVAINEISKLPFGAIFAVGLGALAVQKIAQFEKFKKNDLNVNDSSKIEQDIKNFTEQLNTVKNQLETDEPELIKKFKSMKRLEFNKYLKTYVAQVLEKHGFSKSSVSSGEVEKASAKLDAKLAQHSEITDKENSLLGRV